MPCSAALRAALSAAICAANGVDLREPLKPTWPADAHAITAPVGSVIETIVLLNVDLMWACPAATFCFSLRRTFFGTACWRVWGGIGYFFPAFFFPATVFFRPLRPRALVLVRWPRTGRPLRCRIP